MGTLFSYTTGNSVVLDASLNLLETLVEQHLPQIEASVECTLFNLREGGRKLDALQQLTAAKCIPPNSLDAIVEHYLPQMAKTPKCTIANLSERGMKHDLSNIALKFSPGVPLQLHLCRCFTIFLPS